MPVWMYSKDGAKLFQDDEKIPSGYSDKPTKVEKTYTKKQVLNATDAAIALAEDNGINIDDVEGTGKDGNVTKGDVEALLD